MSDDTIIQLALILSTTVLSLFGCKIVLPKIKTKAPAIKS